MNINEFLNKYSNLISEFEEENPGRLVIWNKKFTNIFMDYLQQNNIKINYKLPKLLIPNRCNYLPHISEFWLKFFQENTYFAKKRVTDEYILEYTPPKDKYVSIKKEFWNIIRHLLKHGIIEHYSRYSYKINKYLVMEYSKDY